VVGTWGERGRTCAAGGRGRGLKIGRRPAVPGGVTVSHDLAPARTVHEPAVPAQPRRPRSVPSQPGPSGSAVGGPPPAGLEDAASIRRAVEALRRALDDGTLHHHRGTGVAGRRAPGVEVVRAWAAGHGVEEQRSACRTCAVTPGA
jgi:hypothetical protein